MPHRTGIKRGLGKRHGGGRQDDQSDVYRQKRKSANRLLVHADPQTGADGNVGDGDDLIRGVGAGDELPADEVDRRVHAERREQVERGGQPDVGLGEAGAHDR
nr:hypothetical protein [Nonomuraea cypriaca]